MPEKEAAFRFVLAVLATWRITHLLAKEDGPGDVVFRFRVLLGESFLGKLMDCFKCLSLWVSAPSAFFVTRQPLELIIIWLAISGAACLLERLGQESVMIQPISQLQNEGVQYELLQPETGNSENQGSANSTS